MCLECIINLPRMRYLLQLILVAAFWTSSRALAADPQAPLPNLADREVRAPKEHTYPDTLAQCDLGLTYSIGRGVAYDSAEAFKLYRKAAEHGEAGAQYVLALMYANGVGVPKDSAEAIKWYRQAAEQGYTWAQCNLGLMYANGEGVPKDEIEGLAWCYISAAAGDEPAIKNREIIEGRLGREAMLLAQQRSKEIFKKIEALKAGQVSPATAR
jgi:TPR repeat protein